MKKWIYILLVSVQAMAQDAQGLFDQANELYRKDKFEEAARTYESIVNSKKMHSPDLYYNLGNAYYKMDRIAPAIYNYEKALLLDPGNNDIKNNLGFAQKMMIDEVKEFPEVGFSAMLKGFTGILTYDGWAWSAVIAAFGFLLFFCGYYFSATTLLKRVFFIAMIAALGLILITIFAAIFEKQRIANDRPAIIFDGIVAMKSEPKESASDGAVIHEGTKVYILESLDQWHHVRLPDGLDGWIRKNSMKELRD